jgi:hypothetical protein
MMIGLLSAEKNQMKISAKCLLLIFFVCISMVAWFGLTDLRADEPEVMFQNAAQAQHADNVARQAALQDPKVNELIELGRYKAARALYHEKVETFTRQISRMRAAGMEWEEITHRYDVHSSVLGLGHSPKTFDDRVHYLKHSSKKGDEYSDRFQNTAQAQRTDNLASQAALQDPLVNDLIDQGRYKAARAVYLGKVETISRQITRLRAAGMGWGDIVHKINREYNYELHPSVLGLGHSPKSFEESVRRSKHSGMKSKSEMVQENSDIAYSDSRQNKQGNGLALGQSKNKSSNRGGGNGGGKGGGNGGGKGGKNK